MPIVDGKYTSPTWVNGAAPALDANEMQSITDTLEDLDTEIEEKQNTLMFDSAPTANSSNPVTSGGVKTALDGKLNLTGGTMSGALAMGGYKITGLGTPTTNTDAATKSYVDGHYVTAGRNPGSTVGASATIEGAYNVASGYAAHAEGYNNTARSSNSHVEGEGNTASASDSHAEGRNNTASGMASHAEGFGNTASVSSSHAEGWGNTASGMASHAEGHGNTVSGNYSHVEGHGTESSHRSQHVFGEYNDQDRSSADQTGRGYFVEIVGNGTSDDARSNARVLDWNGNEVLSGKLTLGTAPTSDMDAATKRYVDDGLSAKMSAMTVDSAPTAGSVNLVTSGGVKTALDEHYVTAGQTSDTSVGTIGTNATAEGGNNNASGSYSHVEGYGNSAYGAYSHAEGNGTEATREASHAEGHGTLASSDYSHAEGYGTSAYGDYAHAEGYETGAGDYAAHAEGNGTTASGQASHAEGFSTTANDSYSHAEGNDTHANGVASHAEGISTTTSGSASHAEGGNTTASGDNAHAEGAFTTAEGYYSHAEGLGTEATHRSQHVFGEYNVLDGSAGSVVDRGNYVEIVGKGNANLRSNARTLDWSGNETLAGKLTLGAAPTSDMDAVTKRYVDSALLSKQNTLTFDSTPTANSSNPVTSNGVKAALNGKLSLSGGTLGGTLTMGSNKITGLAAPTENKDAVTKQYVDNLIAAVYTALAEKQDQLVSTTCTLAAADWSNSAQTVSVYGITSTVNAIITPAPASAEAYGEAGVYCTAQGAGTLTFSCGATAPTVDLTVNILIAG